ncbi:MAG: formylglycine-generating enzyme family protein [Bacteroidales bacterium]|nr:formylglycine-generating enzyme family protein [Bacteroidales bacterium]
MSTLSSSLTFTVSGVSFSLRLVSHGTFLMGADPSTDREAYKYEGPVHAVTISRDYYLAETPVTQALYMAVMGNNPSYFKGDTSRPVECVSWNDCQEFIEKLNSIITDGTFSLPTEAEWEFAARGGNLSKGYKYSGSDVIKEVAWYNRNSDGKTHPVAQNDSNELGLYDMTGNVWEWCQDWYADYPSSPVTDPLGPASGFSRVLRGGCYCALPRGCRLSFRCGDHPDYLDNLNGFRLLFRPKNS